MMYRKFPTHLLSPKTTQILLNHYWLPNNIIYRFTFYMKLSTSPNQTLNRTTIKSGMTNLKQLASLTVLVKQK